MATVQNQLQIRSKSIDIFIDMIAETKESISAPTFADCTSLKLRYKDISNELVARNIAISPKLLKRLFSPWTNYPDLSPCAATDLCLLVIALEMTKQWMMNYNLKPENAVMQFVLEFEFALFPYLKDVSWKEFECVWNTMVDHL